MSRGIFRLKQVYEEQLSGTWSTRGDVWLSPSPFTKAHPFGYFGGGGVPSHVSTVDRIDYANDTATASTKGPLSIGRESCGATGNASFGYFAGGESPGPLSSVDRIDYGNDTATAAAKGPLTTNNSQFAGVGNESFGYIVGGSITGGPAKSTVHRVDYSNDTATAAVKGPLSVDSKMTGATGNASFGYVGGGFGPAGFLSKVDRIDYANDTATASPKGPLSLAREQLSATGNSSFGYFVAGLNPSSNYDSTVDRVDYSNDTATAPTKGPLGTINGRTGSTGNASFGYVGGGYNGSSIISTVSRIDYSNDTGTVPTKGPLSAIRYNLAASSSKANAITSQTLFSASSVRENVAPQGTDFGYYDRGSPSPSHQLQRIDFSNDTATATGRGPTTPTIYRASAVSSASHGYFAGGQDYSGPTAVVSRVDRIDYGNDTAAASPKGPLTAARYALAGTGNANFGYIGGGHGGHTIVDRIDYSNDSATASPRGNLSTSHFFFGAVGNQSFGYFAGAWTSKTTIDRVDYSNDTVTASPKGNMLARTDNGNGFTAGTGNANFGYIGGGGYGGDVSNIDRIDYSNDTATALARGPLATSKYGKAAMGNVDFGYWSGGGNPTVSTVDRLDYSNDTATAAVKGPLIQARQQHAGSSSRMNGNPLKGPGNLEVPVSFGVFSAPGPVPVESSNFGYFVGGMPGALTTVDRVDYSNDTAAAATKGPLSAAGNYLNGASNLTHGYKLGGRNSSNTRVSTVERIDYANDTATAVARGPLSSVRYRGGATGNNNFGYYAGGTNPSTESTVDRIDYSNDSATAVVKGPLTSTRYLLSATGNSNFGYFGGGNPSPNLSKVDRIDYANDTATASPKGNLSLGRRKLAAVGTADFGYFASGTTPGNTVIDRVDYANDTATAVAKGPTAVQTSNAGSASSVTHGYFGGGTPGALSTVQRIDYANDTATASPKGPLTSPKATTAGMSSKDGGLPKTQIGTVNYPKGTYATPNTGYVVGGFDPSYRSNVERIDYANDNVATSSKGSIGTAVRYSSSIANGTHLYVSGGGAATNYSTVERIDFVNDTVDPVLKGPLIGPRQRHAAVGNQNFGYLTGGEAPSTVSSVDRVDYSNDTATASAKGNLSQLTKEHGATGNQNFGYIGGGNNPALNPTEISTVSRIDYSNDTATSSPKGPLATVRATLAATGNADYGWFGGGGGIPNGKTNVERVDFSNDTVTASVRGNLEVGRSNLSGATGSQNFGYWAAGHYNSKSSISRVDYANDTNLALHRGNLPFVSYGNSAGSARANGFVPIGPSVVANAPVQNVPPGANQSWEILMHTTGQKNTTNNQGDTGQYGNTGSSTWRTISSPSTGANNRTAFGDGAGLYDAFFTKTGITKIALVDGTGNMDNMTSHNNYLVYDLVGTGTGNESIHDILHRLDQYNLNNPSWARDDIQFGTDSCTDFVAGTAKSGTLSAQGGSWEANSSAPTSTSPSPSTTTQLHNFCIWGVNRDSDNDTQVLCAYAGNLQTGKGDSWRNQNPDETFWSYWGNDWHSSSISQTLSAGSQTDPGVVTGEPTTAVYLMGYGTA